MSDDSTTSIQELKSEILSFVHERDWEQFHSPKNLSMALSAETAELMEHFLWSESEASKSKSQEPVLKEKIEEEIADVFIYAMEFANICKIDLASAVRRKIKINGEKYPVEKAKGNSLKYTELD